MVPGEQLRHSASPPQRDDLCRPRGLWADAAGEMTDRLIIDLSVYDSDHVIDHMIQMIQLSIKVTEADDAEKQITVK